MRPNMLLVALASGAALALGACSGPADSSQAERPESTPVPPEVRKWLRGWCRVRPRMSRERIHSIMGPPTLRDSSPRGVDPSVVATQEEWTVIPGAGRKGFTFVAFFDPEDKAIQLQTLGTRLSCARVGRSAR